MGRIEFIFFSVVLIIISDVITLPVNAIRHQKQKSGTILSLSLHPRDSIINPKTHNYTTRTRMEADAARVTYLNSRLKNALFKSEPGYEAENIQSPLIGLRGGYVARIGVGQPATKSTLIADTGSEIVWLKCSPCSQCSDPVFDPSKSSSYQSLSCTAPQCSSNTDGLTCAAAASTSEGKCGFQASYGDGSATRGDFVTETLSFGSSGSVKNVAIGCGHEVGGNLQSFDGILGLGPDPISLPSQLKATSFSYCLVGSGSRSTSGTLDFNSATPGDSIIVRMVRNPRKDIYYYVELTGITVGENQIPVPQEVYQIGSDGTGGVIVDSGTTLTYLDSQVYSSLMAAFQNNAQDLAPSAVDQEGSDVCYTFSSGSSLQGPAMSFQFSGDQSLTFGPENYFVQVDESTYCLAFKPTNQIVSIIGNIVQKGMRVTYDLGNNQIGFSRNKC